MRQRDAQNAMNVHQELAGLQVGHERQIQELRDSLKTKQSELVQEVESKAEQRLMAQNQRHEQELKNVRQSYVEE